MKSNNTVKFLTATLAAIIAYFIPEYSSGDLVLDAMINFLSFAPLVIVVSSFLNTTLQWQDMKAYTLTGIVSLILGYSAYFADIGFLAHSSSLWFHPIITSLGIFASATLGFSHQQIKQVLTWLFDYSWKLKNDNK